MIYVIQVLLSACEQDQYGTGSILILSPKDFADSLRAGSGWNWFHPDPVAKTCMTHTIAVCTVKNS